MVKREQQRGSKRSSQDRRAVTSTMPSIIFMMILFFLVIIILFNFNVFAVPSNNEQYGNVSATEVRNQKAASLKSVSVWNGWGDPGAASYAMSSINEVGYLCGDIGDAPSYHYTTTVIVCQTDKDIALAQEIKPILGCGDIIVSLGRYDFSGSILIIIGKDYCESIDVGESSRVGFEQRVACLLPAL